MNLKNRLIFNYKKRPRVYILPTKMGGYLIGLIGLLFLLSIGYNNNLLLVFTLLLFSFNLMWLVQTNFHLHQLKLESVHLSDGHAGELSPVVINWKKSPANALAWELKLESGNNDVAIQYGEHAKNKSLGEFIIPPRGLWQWSYLKVSTERPYGLYRTWKYFTLNQTSYSYPSLREHSDIKLTGNFGEGEHPVDRPGTEDLRQLLPYQGTESRLISWKHYAKSGELLIKEGEELAHQVAFLRVDPVSLSSRKEEHLSDLAGQMRHCYIHQIPFRFEGHEGVKGAGSNQDYLIECLRILASC